MKRHILPALLVGLILSLPLVAVFYVADQLFGLPFLPFDLFDLLTRILPGPLLTFGIDLMIDSMRLAGISVVDTAKTAERLMSVAMFVGLLTVIGGGFMLWKLKTESTPRRREGAIFGATVGLVMLIIHLLIAQSNMSPILRGLWIVLSLSGWGASGGYVIARLMDSQTEPAEEEEEETLSVAALDRRRFLIKMGTTAATITLIGAGVGGGIARAEKRRRDEMFAAAYGDSLLPDWLPNINDAVIAAPGTRPEYTPIEDHYLVFVRTQPSVVEGEGWTLDIDGLVDSPLSLTLDEIRANYTAQDQFVTLSCISGRIGTELIGTTLWTGTRLKDILADAGLQSGATHLNIEAADGFHETVDLALIEDERVMLAYDWNRQPLTPEHGFPIRIYIPDRYGMKQPRWITKITVIGDYTPGYWVIRGWDKDAIVNTISMVDTVALSATYDEGGQTLIPIGGIANSGAKGISKVEVRVDDGEWVEAQIRAPLSEISWTIWRYDWPYQEGEHTFEVRCTESDGTGQIEKRRGNRPSGATGLHSETVDV